MGGRGAYSGGLLQNGSCREYYQIGHADDIKIISKFDNKDSRSLPVRSNTSNRIYGILDKDGNPKQIGIYKNNYLVTTIDFPDKHKNYIHANDWGTISLEEKGAITKRINERLKLSDYEQSLVYSFVNNKSVGG